MSKDIHKWTDGRYTLMFDEHTFFVWDNEKDDRMTALNVTKRLNEQQDQLNSLILSIKAKDRHIKNQQVAIKKLQDLCAESDSENAKLRIENEKLRKELKRICNLECENCKEEWCEKK